METEDQKDEAELQGLYKTKVVQFLGRSVPIILQNDNGPCPLIGICNVLLLRNSINISSEASEISLKKLLSLVAGRLLDSNGDIQDKDAGYIENQQRNIHDAIEMLPRLATGLDVNLHFTRIDEFEFTPERSIFDLLGIELYHGWIVDPQDTDTLKAIGSKSYNALMEEIVSLEDTGSIEGEHENTFEEDPIDFVAATTATLGVPSPSLSRTISFDDSKVLGAGEERIRKGDREEEEELLRVLQLSKANLSTSSIDLPKDPFSMGSTSGSPPNSLEGSGEECQRPQHPETCTPNHHSFAVTSGTEASQSFFEVASENDINQLNCNKSRDSFISSNFTENMSTLGQNRIAPVLFQDGDYSAGSNSCENHTNGWIGDQPVQQTCMIMDDLKLGEENKSYSDDKHPVFPDLISTKDHSSFTDETRVPVDVSVGSVVPSLDGTEPIYEGEECIIDAGRPAYEIHEPMYEGEMVLAEQADRVAGDAANMYLNDELSKGQTKVKLNISANEGELIRNFVKNSASQLTIYGLFCLQEGLKERELCVFFRNNHFSTMFKFNGELYLLATDQGYINQPDLVWEKLNEVNGDTIFVTGCFTQFNAECHDEAAWDDKNAMANTSDYLATIDNSTAEGSFLNSDMQLAIALQQQEFEQRQPQHQPPCTLQLRSDSETSRLSKGPQGSRSSSSPKSEEKSKDKCAVM